MTDDKRAEKVSDAVARARSILYSVFSAALLIGFVAIVDLAERQSTYERLMADLSSLSNITTRSDHAIREIRRYFLIRAPDLYSDEEKVRQIVATVEQARRNTSAASDRLLTLSPIENGNTDMIRAINLLLKPYQPESSLAASPLVDYSPQSVVILDRLESYRLRDIAVLAHLAGADPIAFAKPISEFVGEPSRETPAAANQLLAKLTEIRADGDNRGFSRVRVEGEQLRTAIELRGLQHGGLAVGGLFSSHEEALRHARVLEERTRILTQALEGDFGIDVPVVDIRIPARVVVGLFPLGLIIGFGLISGALAYARDQLKGFTDTVAKKAAADIGTEFCELRKSDLGVRMLAWFPLIGLLSIPIAAAVVLVIQYGRTLDALEVVLLWALLAGACWMSVNIIRFAISISGDAAK